MPKVTCVSKHNKHHLTPRSAYHPSLERANRTDPAIILSAYSKPDNVLPAKAICQAQWLSLQGTKQEQAASFNSNSPEGVLLRRGPASPATLTLMGPPHTPQCVGSGPSPQHRGFCTRSTSIFSDESEEIPLPKAPGKSQLN